MLDGLCLNQGVVMPVFSYLAYPKKNLKQQLILDLSSMDYCDVEPADNKDVLILVTDAPDSESDKSLQQKIRELDSLQSISMTFGHTDG